MGNMLQCDSHSNLVYIFLDIDGVLNNETYLMKCYERHHVNGIMSMCNFPFDPECLSNLMILVQDLQGALYEVRIILSSTWRLDEISTAIVNSRLAEFGLRCFDKTPVLSTGRGSEIGEYLKDKVYNNIIILDDDSFDIEPYYPNNLVQTKFKTGFTEECLNKALKVISG